MIALRWPTLGTGIFSRIEKVLGKIAEHDRLSIIGTGLLVIVLRLSVWPLIGTPIPEVHDEFSYLLAGDTFVHARLTNPPHPMWIYFETFHEIQQPTYMSKYPPAQGAVLALGQRLGHPWIGVLFSVAIMCGAITWMLRGWFPSAWALVGGIIAALYFGSTNYWISSYFGGAVAATGGALMLGALPRILVHGRYSDSILFGLGIAILANSRPYEGLVFCVCMMGALAYWLLKKRRQRQALLQVVIPVLVVLILLGAFIGYYNLRVTGRSTVLPYMRYNRTYANCPDFFWQKLEPPKSYRNPQLAVFFDRERAGCLAEREWSWQGLRLTFLKKVLILQDFYAPPQFLLPIASALLSWKKSRKLRFLVLVCGVLVLGMMAVTFANAHYAAPLTASVFAMIVFGLKRLRLWQTAGRPVGLAIARALVVFQFLLLPVQAGALYSLHHFRVSQSRAFARARSEVEKTLESMPEKHLVIVRYSSNHDVDLGDWVFNRADIDNAKVVWAREIPGMDLRPLLHYFQQRKTWLAEPDAKPPQLSLYRP